MQRSTNTHTPSFSHPHFPLHNIIVKGLLEPTNITYNLIDYYIQTGVHTTTNNRKTLVILASGFEV